MIGKAGRPQTRRNRSEKLSEDAGHSGKVDGISPPLPADTGSQFVFSGAAIPDGAALGGPSPSLTSPGGFSDFEPQEVKLAQYLVQDQRLDRRFVNSFAVESFFLETMESSLVRQLLAAPDQVKDAMLALSGALIAAEESPSEQGNAETMENLKLCCTALERLRLSDTASEDDARAILFVATSLVSVNDLTIGYGYLPIVRSALLAVEPWVPQLMQRSSSQFDANFIPVIFAEAMECQRCNEVPTIHWRTPSPQLIDRSYGIAHEVLPYLYDICILSHEASSESFNPAMLETRASEIRRDLDLWEPRLRMNAPEDEELYLSSEQRAQMLSHAHCYKLLAFLLLEQLQAPLKNNRHERAELARLIRQRVDQFCTITENPQVLYLLYPYFVACAELEDTAEQGLVLAKMKYLSGGIATQACETMFRFLQFAWASASVDSTTTWLELIHIGPSFSIGP